MNAFKKEKPFIIYGLGERGKIYYDFCNHIEGNPATVMMRRRRWECRFCSLCLTGTVFRRSHRS